VNSLSGRLRGLAEVFWFFCALLCEAWEKAPGLTLAVVLTGSVAGSVTQWSLHTKWLVIKGKKLPLGN